MSIIAGVASFGSTTPTVYTLYADSVKPTIVSDSDHRSTEVGVRFTADGTAAVLGIRFYKAKDNTGLHTGTLWNTSGQVLAQVKFSDETSSGWQSAKFDKPIQLVSGQSYVASYHAAGGHYSASPGEFKNGDTLTKKSLTATRGVYSYASSTTYPRATWNDAGYGVDLMFSTQPGLGVSASPSSSAISSSSTPTASATPSQSSTKPTASAPSSSKPAPPTSSAAPSKSTTPPPPSSSTPPAPPVTSSAYPNASNTGVSTAGLQAVPGSVTSGPGWQWDSRGWVAITGANAVFSGYKVSGGIEVYNAHVTVSGNDIAKTGDGWAIGLRPGVSGTIVKGNNIHGQDAGSNRLLYGVFNVAGDDPTLQVLDNNIYYTDHGIQVEQGLIEDNYIHDMGKASGDHVDGIFSGGGDTGQLTIRHNNISNAFDQTSAIILSNAFGKQTNRLVDDNLLAGGGYTLYGGDGQPYGSSNIVVTNNKFSTSVWPKGGYYGSPVIAFSTGSSGNKWSGNVWYDGPDKGQTVNPVS